MLIMNAETKIYCMIMIPNIDTIETNRKQGFVSHKLTLFLLDFDLLKHAIK